MSDSPKQPWSNNPNAPRISAAAYTADKELFAGHILGAITYGIVVILFFQCMEALVGPVNNIGRRAKWGLLAHTMALFLFLAMPATMDLYATSLEYVDNRNFPRTGPVGYDDTSNFSTAFLVIYTATFPMSQWLADGLLLYRCYIIYSMNYWIMVFPFLIYIASVATGIMSTYEVSSSVAVLSGAITAYYLICLSLNILLTLMIIARLVLHSRNIRQATGTLDRAMGLYSTISTMLVESCALYSAALLFYIVPFAIGSWIASIPTRVLPQFQVIAPYLIILRVAKQRALTGEMVTSGSNRVGSIQFASQGTTDGDRSIPDGDLIFSMEANGKAPDEVGTRAENEIEEIPLRQSPEIA